MENTWTYFYNEKGDYTIAEGTPDEPGNLLFYVKHQDHAFRIVADHNSLKQQLSDLQDKVDFYRNDTAKIRDFVFDSKSIGHPTQSIFEAVMDKFIGLYAEIENLQSVMVAAAEEIQEHWHAHCDEEGYGPANLMHRLEKGIAANYPGYKAGAFNVLTEQANELQTIVNDQQAEIENLKHENAILNDYTNHSKLVEALTRISNGNDDATMREWAKEALESIKQS